MSTPIAGPLGVMSPLYVAPGDIAVWWDDLGLTWESIPLGSGPAGPAGPAGATGAQGPAGSANMSGMVAGRIPIAATPTTVTSSANLSGDVTSNASLVTTLATVNANVGTFQGLTVNAKGQVIAAANQSYVTGGPYLALSGGAITGNLSVSGTLGIGAALLSIVGGGSYFQVSDPAGGGAVTLGGADPTNYYSNTSHRFRNRATSTIWAIIDTAGTANISGAWTVISDRAMKVEESIKPYTRGLEAILRLNPVEFRYIAGSPFAEADKPSRQLFGLLADEVEPIVPEIVGSTTATVAGKEQSVDTLEPGNLIYALINAVKELSARVSELAGPGKMA